MLKDYKVKQGETIYNIALNLYGEVSYAFKLANDNDIAIDANIDGLTLVYDDAVKDTVLEPLIIPEPIKKNVIQTYVSRFGQSIFDISLNLTGSVENALHTALDSNMTNLNNALNSTYKFTYTQSADPLVKWSDNRGIIYNTGVQLETPKLGEYDSSFDQQAFS
jgi:hypothetical protein